MATIKIEIVGETVGSMAVVTVLDTANAARLMGYLSATYGRKVTNGIATMRTPEEIIECYWNDIVADTGRKIEASERASAAKAAADAVPPFAVNN